MLRSNSKSLGNFTLYFSGRGCKSLRDWAPTEYSCSWHWRGSATATGQLKKQRGGWCTADIRAVDIIINLQLSHPCPAPARISDHCRALYGDYTDRHSALLRYLAARILVCFAAKPWEEKRSYFWHCPRTTRSSVCVAVRCLPASLFHSSAAAARGRFAAVGPASRRYSHVFDGDAHWRQMANAMDRPVRRRRCGLLSSPLLSRASSLRSLYMEGKCADTMLAQCWFRGLATHFQR